MSKTVERDKKETVRIEDIDPSGKIYAYLDGSGRIQTLLYNQGRWNWMPLAIAYGVRDKSYATPQAAVQSISFSIDVHQCDDQQDFVDWINKVTGKKS